MSIIFNIILYLLLFIIAIFLLAMIIPIRYSFNGGYKNNLYGYGSVSVLQFCKISMSYDTNGIASKVKLFGFSINIDPEATKNKKAKIEKAKPDKKPHKKEKSSQGKKSLGFIKQLFKKDIIFHVLYLLKDLVNILKPKVLMISGKIGFYEPHHTAWLQAILSSLSDLNIHAKLDIETIWDDEYYEGELVIKGQLVILVILARLLRFLISKNTIKVWRIFRSEQKRKKLIKHAT